MDEQTDALDEARLIVEHGLARRIAEIVAPPVRDLGYRVVRVKVSTSQTPMLQVMLEKADGTMDVEDCSLASEEISPHLDLEDPIGAPYRLEVSSPGIDRPLVRESDFRRAIGHEARIELSRPLDGRKRFRGAIETVETVDGGLVIDLRLKGDSEEEVVARLAVADISEARLVLTDDLIRAALRREKTEIRSRKSEVKKQKADTRKQKSEDGKRKASP